MLGQFANQGYSYAGHSATVRFSVCFLKGGGLFLFISWCLLYRCLHWLALACVHWVVLAYLTRVARWCLVAMLTPVARRRQSFAPLNCKQPHHTTPHKQGYNKQRTHHHNSIKHYNSICLPPIIKTCFVSSFFCSTLTICFGLPYIYSKYSLIA